MNVIITTVCGCALSRLESKLQVSAACWESALTSPEVVVVFAVFGAQNRKSLALLGQLTGDQGL